jgi:tRNA-specific 2-thiouridylase
MHKSEVRALAKSAGLANAERKDSVGVCFIGKRRFDEFLSQYLSASPGRFVSLSGEDLGEHKGAVYYTVGQRASISGAKQKYVSIGMPLGSTNDCSHRHYIVGKDMQSNVVYVASGANHPALFSDELTTRHFNWIGGEPPSELLKHGSMQCHYKVRYRLNYGSCNVTLPDPHTPTHVTVRFDIPQRSVTPQQFVALYSDQVCLGGGPIDEPGPSYYTLKKDVPAVVCE